MLSPHSQYKNNPTEFWRKNPAEIKGAKGHFFRPSFLCCKFRQSFLCKIVTNNEGGMWISYQAFLPFGIVSNVFEPTWHRWRAKNFFFGGGKISSYFLRKGGRKKILTGCEKDIDIRESSPWRITKKNRKLFRKPKEKSEELIPSSQEKGRPVLAFCFL